MTIEELREFVRLLELFKNTQLLVRYADLRTYGIVDEIATQAASILSQREG